MSQPGCAQCPFIREWNQARLLISQAAFEEELALARGAALGQLEEELLDRSCVTGADRERRRGRAGPPTWKWANVAVPKPRPSAMKTMA
eukprot:6885052-Pyramimonas_sp.AAC.1